MKREQLKYVLERMGYWMTRDVTNRVFQDHVLVVSGTTRQIEKHFTVELADYRVDMSGQQRDYEQHMGML